VSFSTPDGTLEAVRGLTFHVEQGETLGVVGESGAGKSVALQAIVGLAPGATVSGVARFHGEDLLAMPERRLQRTLGRQIAMVFQDPSSSLHPLYRVGWQIVEVIRAHSSISRPAARRRAVELLDLVGIPSPGRRVDDYPHQFSGGMRQRAMIAMAVALNPALLIADEPTTALDVTVQAQVLELLQRLQAEFHMAVIIVTHDLGVIAEVADRVLVVYAGRLVEQADTRTIFHDPHHPYTRGLLESLPERGRRGGRLVAIAGQPPSMLHIPAGCSFHPRCPDVMSVCRTDDPPLRVLAASVDHCSACWLDGGGGDR
jgi:oligopeptide/dipeptide ABC transporter ATP-binding protein